MSNFLPRKHETHEKALKSVTSGIFVRYAQISRPVGAESGRFKKNATHRVEDCLT